MNNPIDHYNNLGQHHALGEMNKGNYYPQDIAKNNVLNLQYFEQRTIW
jgi:hypothetical protein